jgi:L-Ala-D/L-Glu epimerase
VASLAAAGRWYVPPVEVSARILTLELAETFVISRSARDSEDVLVVELRHSGVAGFGEAQPLDHYGESVESAQAYVGEHAELLGDDPFALEEVMERLPSGEFAARAAVDAALHDLQGKLLGQPVWRLLGLRRAGSPTSWTVWLGDPDDMAGRAEKALDRFRRLKLKLGGRDGLDVERVRAVRGVAGDLPLQVDVNEAWSLDEALEALPALAELGVEYCEQPLPAGDEGGPELKQRSPVPVYVDEDCHTLGDVAACAERAHGINVKLAKSGGIREAVRMAHAARALGLGCMLGCMVESGLGISAGAQVASLFDHVDLDGNLLLAHDPWPGVAFVDGVQLPPEEPGLGVHSVPAAR